MKDEEILTKLKSAYTKITPNNYNHVKNNLKKEGSDYLKNKKWFVFAPILAVVIVCVIIGMNYINNDITNVTIDVNPSINLKVNKNEEIISAEAMNDDAKKILENIKLKSVDLNTGIHALIGSMLKHGYIDEIKNSILVTVQNNDTQKGKELQTKLDSEISSILETYKIASSVVSQTLTENTELEKMAESYNISTGKTNLINSIVASNPLYSFDELSKLSIQELNLLASKKTVELDNITVTGSASEKNYIGRDRALEIALKDASTTKSDAKNIEVEFDYDDGVMLYEVDFRTTYVEYEYDINAKTGEIIKVDKEGEDNKGTSNNSTNSSTTSASSNSSNNKDIGRSVALNKALSHAGLKESEVKDISVEKDYENGKSIYEIEFEHGRYEYEYDIDATTGDIITSKKDD